MKRKVVARSKSSATKTEFGPEEIAQRKAKHAESLQAAAGKKVKAEGAEGTAAKAAAPKKKVVKKTAHTTKPFGDNKRMSRLKTNKLFGVKKTTKTTTKLPMTCKRRSRFPFTLTWLALILRDTNGCEYM